MSAPPPLDDEHVKALVEALEAIAENRRLLADVPEELRHRLLMSAGRVSRPERHEQRKLAKEFRKREKNAIRQADEQLLARTGIRKGQKAPVFRTPDLLPRNVATTTPEPEGDLHNARKCYICKRHFTEVHHFYASMCTRCGDVNWQKRQQTADLTGHVALVTGARVKIGYQASIMLLRAGAHVIVTTRFPRDAATRYANEADYDSFRDRLEVYGVDLRHTPSVEAFTKHIDRTHSRLDYILNNACQTVRRPTGFYAHLIEKEQLPFDALPEKERRLLLGHEAIRAGAPTPVLSNDRTESARAHLEKARALAIHDSAALSQISLLEEDLERGAHLFPAGALDQDLQQIDLRDRNTWRLRLSEVAAAELLEVHLVNAVAPFVLNARLKPLMERTPNTGKHIVNVSAMEGQFYRAYKTDKHPHTNMAKAALNMMTRTSAVDYKASDIHMNSVDTGWVTDEDPAVLAERKTLEHGFHPPLDIVDGAARIVDPIFNGIATGEHVWGQFLKDYKPTEW